MSKHYLPETIIIGTSSNTLTSKKGNKMTIAIIATLKVVEGKNDEFETIMKELEQKVNENEDGCNFYHVNKSLSDPQTYVVMEQYINNEAIGAHAKTDYFRSLGKAMKPFLDGGPKIEMLEGL